ncbi:phosphate ABC transporter ATP-binding protein [Fructobacillus tropaeoli]|uniref:ATPase component (PstB) n=2 Tax=Fructobacillus tropaeoli TaxID=709323 RepID=A0A3F3GZ30_9LACO|nr:phosphate ABC transporter ATP-binding protein PstB [Fructobacillus tropaeoli]NLS38118.1 phosphate ABC transporter ATP-binding protein [Fructobacillus tropaeoli]CAK1230783.1 ABC-type phosphate transport system [Fructobacillus tropaeoli]CAK1231472.1 ABC-type phosphate transport system [Fructobacillus tropaeoli]CAK1232131.1 ABC-type phosphate transport system [Fructobacillus tropaeoli]CAK1253865.1 ABC-type phosphate transport system [Fructobacillus tropaeoli]
MTDKSQELKPVSDFIPEKAPERYIIPMEDDKHEIALSTENLQVSYGDNLSLSEGDLRFERYKITSLIGASGSGKSTFLRSLNRMNDGVANVTGHIWYRGLDINSQDIDVYEMRRHIGMVFQRPNPFAKSIYDNITFPLTRRGKYTKAQLDEIVETTLKQAALWDQVKDELNKSALSLSGGQAQRLVIARALALKPDILLLDEPSSALDPISSAQFEDTLLELKKNYTIIIVTHNMQQAARISDYTAFMHQGKVIEYDLTRKIFTRPKVELTNDYISGNFG